MSQLPPPNRLTNEEWYNQCKTFFEKHPTNTSSIVISNLHLMYDLWNDKFLPRRTDVYCSTCSGWVYDRLKERFDNYGK